MSTITAAEPFRVRRQYALLKIIGEIRLIVWRNLAHIPRVPERLADVTVMPILMVLLFGYVFGGAIALPGVEVGPEASAAYREFLIAGVFVYMMVFGSVSTAVGVSNDMREGVIDRFRSLPISRWSLLGGRAIATLAEASIAITVMAIAGLLVGWGAHNGFWSAIGGFALLAGIAFAMICVGTFVGQLVKNATTAQTIGIAVAFPLSFASNAFVPTDNMPVVVEVFAEWNPVSAWAQALREVFGNVTAPVDVAAPWPLQNPVLASVMWIVVLAAIGMTLAVWKYSRGSNH